MHLLTALKRLATEILYSIPVGAAYEDIIEAFQGCYRDHQLASPYHSHLKFWSQENFLVSAGLWTRLEDGTTGYRPGAMEGGANRTTLAWLDRAPELRARA